MKATTRTFLAGLALATVLGTVDTRAQDYPSRPITIVVSTAAGGGNDIMARVIGERMSRTLGQQIVVENRPGAGGTTATRQIAKARRTATRSGWATPARWRRGRRSITNAGYDPTTDFTAIGLIANAPVVIVVHPDGRRRNRCRSSSRSPSASPASSATDRAARARPIIWSA